MNFEATLSVKCICRYKLALSYSWLQERAKKALEGALGGKKDEFEKWNEGN